MSDMRKIINEMQDNPFGLTEASDGEDLGSRLLVKLADYGENGLPDVYDSPEDYLWDMYPDLPWNPQGTLEALQYMVAQPELRKINQNWIKKIGFNIEAELRGALKQTQKEIWDARPQDRGEV